MPILKQLAAIFLLIPLLAGACRTHGFHHTPSSYGLPYDDPEAYIRSLEDAMDARYGGREKWPQGFDAFPAIAKYCAGIEPSYESTLAWAPDWLLALEANVIAGAGGKLAAEELLNALARAMEIRYGPARTLPYEAQALMDAAFLYLSGPPPRWDGGRDVYRVWPGANGMGAVNAPPEEALCAAPNEGNG